MKKQILAILTFAGMIPAAVAANVTVTMNTVSKTMSFVSKTTGEAVETGAPDSKNVYTFEAPEGEYVLTGIATDGSTVNGTIVLNVEEGDNSFAVLTCTAYATNRNEDKTYWTEEAGDYTLDVRVNTREGKAQEITLGKSTTAGRRTFLALNGNSYFATFTPSEAHAAEGYVPLYKSANITFNATVSGAIPQSDLYTVTAPKEAEFQLNIKFSHFVDFTPVQPLSVEPDGDKLKYTYRLAKGQVYNFRTSMPGTLTLGGYFNMNTDEAKRPVLDFTKDDYTAISPKTIYHDVNHNRGYETGDILVNVNEKGWLNMSVGQTFKAHAMRSWELTDSQTNNYFIEPDFHYTVISPDGKPSDILTVSQKPGSAWADITARSAGTAIVLVTYDAINLNYYASSTGAKTAFMGGENWSAIWPENTAAYVVTIDMPESAAVPEMFINEEYNLETMKMAGKYVDAEHDVFYYLDTQEGYPFTFAAKDASAVTVAYPLIGQQAATYAGFGSEGVTDNGDGTFTVLLKEGRQIVRIADDRGNAAYQVLTAKPCHCEITNETTPGSTDFLPGDEVKIQYSGLRHPANKLAGIYNMSAGVTYNGIPNGTSLILGAGQYTFGSVAKAQAVSITIPADYDADSNPEMKLTDGVIQVNGYGDPIGNHRYIDPVAGRSPNFTAIAHKTYFGALPDVIIPVKGKDSAVDSVATDTQAQPVVYYNLQGVASETPWQGLNIVRYTDGSSRKIYVK